MVAKTRAASTRSSGRRAARPEPDVYQQLLAEAGVGAAAPASPERPLKKRRTAARASSPPGLDEASAAEKSVAEPSSGPADDDDDDEEEGIEFEDVVLPEPTVQTLERESSDEDGEGEDEEDIPLEDVDFLNWLGDAGPAPKEPAADLELNLGAQQPSSAAGRRPGEQRRRRPMTREEREQRVRAHQAHLVCLLAHAARRNHWCNDGAAQAALRPLLTDKTARYLTPGAHLPQFGRAESLKTGLRQAEDVWKTRFEVTRRGLRRALWAEEPEHLEDYEPPSDLDSCLDRADFREAARTLQGSRDVGAQLYCALLRSVGVRARLVCSLQPLACVGGGPTLPKPREKAKMSTPTKNKSIPDVKARAEVTTEKEAASSPVGLSARRRLGHPHAAAYNFKPAPSPPRARKAFEAPVKIRESPFPVYWVEVLDVGHQKWQPVDPVVLRSFWKPKIFEPPITDKENSLCYVIAFEADGTAKDVTRRYAKAYTAKTRKLRVESAMEDGDAWWRRVMKFFRPKRPTDLDLIEDNELAGAEAREPMPRNVQDFKNHPVYALERHLRRHEALIPDATPSGTVASGTRGPLEKVYRRKDVRVVRSADKWYRLGREVKPNEIPAKWLPKRAKPRRSRLESPEEVEADDAGVPVYRLDQTELYEPPPVRNGRVPKNKFGNIEVYVPSMVPRGAVHIIHEHARRAAYLLGIDHAPALTGFEFKGRQGTAVLRGIVVAAEYQEAVQAVLDGLGNVEQELADERKRLLALRMWRKLLMGLRIRERIWSGVDAVEKDEAERQAELEAGISDAESDMTEELDMVVDDEGEGGGFLIE